MSRLPKHRGNNMTTRIVITTPTGNIGRKVTDLLLDAQEQQDLEIVLLARKPESVEQAARRGATRSWWGSTPVRD